MSCNAVDFSVLTEDLVDSDDSLSVYCRRCIDGYNKFIPDVLTVTMDGLVDYIIKDGVASFMCDNLCDYLDSDLFLGIANENECVTLRYDAQMKAIDILVSPPIGSQRTTLRDLCDRSIARYGQPIVSMDEFNYFINTKAFCYKNRFGECFPMKYASEDANDFVSRINVCLYNGEKADLLAKRYGWE